MKDEAKTKIQILSELADLRSRLAELETLKEDFEQTNLRLKESEERFRRLVELSPYGIGIACDGVAVFVNDAVAKMLGAKTPSEIIGKPILGFVHESSIQEATGHVRQVFEEGKPVVYAEEKFVRLDGELVDVEVTAIPFTYEGKPSIQAMFHDITAKKEAEQALRLERQKFQSLAEQAPFAMAIIAKSGEIRYVNSKFKEVFGYDAHDIPSVTHWYQLAYPNPVYRDEVVSAWLEDIARLESGEASTRTFSVVRKDGSERTIHFRLAELENHDHLVTAEDVTERKFMEEAVRKSEKLYRSLVDTMNEGFGIQDRDGIITYVNEKICTLWGYSSDQILGRPVTDFLDEANVQILRARMASRRRGSDASYEIVWTGKDGRKIPTIMSPRPLYDSQGEYVGSFAVITDITERKNTEDRIKASLNEKELLLREIHHRVKNNLQVISSLLRLQSRTAPARQSREIFAESQNRLQSIALIHELLYRSKNLADIDFGAYINSLTVQLFYAYGVAGSRISLKTEVVSAPMAINVAMPCGLIANELISNCLKHAFPGDRKGLIKVSLASSNGIYEFTISDDGVGLPKSVDVHGGQSLGLSLVNTLVKQLKGEVEVQRSPGTHFRIKFKELKPAERPVS
jgi:PAS domain S-box-containing protein